MKFKIVATNEGSKKLLNESFSVENFNLNSLPFKKDAIINSVLFFLEFKSISFLNDEFLINCFIISESGDCSGRVVIKLDL